MKKNVLFLCTKNSCRSQMAEGILRHLYGDLFEVYSAGTKPSRVNPRAIQVMSEIEIDISKHQAKSVSEFLKQRFDYIVTLCDNAKETCPRFPGLAEYRHWNLSDPAKVTGAEEKVMTAFRKARDQIKLNIEQQFREVIKP